jgi:hypothetical protein
LAKAICERLRASRRARSAWLKCTFISTSAASAGLSPKKALAVSTRQSCTSLEEVLVAEIHAHRFFSQRAIIKALPVDACINDVAEQIVSDLIEVERIERLLEKWRVAAIMFGILVAVGAGIWGF